MKFVTRVPSPPSDVPAYGYIRGLDGLRLIAVLIVVVAHYRISSMLPGGFGVTVFFAISGFLISRLLLAEENRDGSISFPNFFARRFLRLMPALVIMFLITLAIYLVATPHEINITQLILAFFYLSNFYTVAEVFFTLPPGIHGYGPLWSLAVEEHFYLMFPLMLIVLRTWRARVTILVSVLVFSLALRVVAFSIVSDPEAFNYYFTFTRLDSIAWGCLLTFALAKPKWRDLLGRMRGLKSFSLALVLLLGGIALRNEFFQDTFRYTIHGIGMALLINVFVFGHATDMLMRMAEWKIFRIGGRISYETYLWHLHVWFVVSLISTNYWATFGISLVSTLLISYGFYRVTTASTRRIAKRVGSKNVDDERNRINQNHISATHPTATDRAVHLLT